MNILIVTGDMNSGGAETHVYELSRFLAARGNAVTVASSGGVLASALCAEGIPHIRLPLSLKNPVSVTKSIRGLEGLLRERKFHVVHAHTRISAFVASVACERVGVPLVTTVHARYRDSRLLDSLSRWGRATVAVSHDLVQYLLSHSRDVLAESIRVISNGIDTERFSPSERCTERTCIVFASRLDDDCSDAAYALCDIAERLFEKFRDLDIVICGGGSEYPRILEAARKVNVRTGCEQIRTVGHAEDMSSVLREASLFIGVSRAALEAMSCAVPVILAGNEGFFGVVTEEHLAHCEKSNFCCRGEDKIGSEVLFDAICTVLAMTPSERVRLGNDLRAYVVRHHSAEHMAEKTEELYREVSVVRRRNGGGVLLCGYYGFGNMGDDALLLRAVEHARKKYPSLPVCAMTARGRQDSEKFGVRCEKRSSPTALMREIRGCEVLVFGGGTLLQNSTSSRSLYYYVRILRYARRYGKRIELWGNGIGALKGERSHRAAARALCNCDYIGLRDRHSVREAVRLLGDYGLPAPHMVLDGDLALAPFTTDRGRSEYIASLFGVSRSERYAVVALRGTESRERLTAMREWLLALRRGGVRLVFIIMYPKEDLKVSRRLCGELDGTLAHPLGISDVTELIRGASVVCSMRYHALVFAASVGTPFVGFGGEEKIRSFCEERGLTFFL